MSQFNIFNPISWFAPRAPFIAPDSPKPDKAPDLKPSTTAQTVYGGGSDLMGGGFSGLPISINGAVLGYQGGAIPWVQPPRYWYGTYRIMRLHPTLTIARNAVIDPIRANQWTIKGKEKDTNPDWIKFVSDQVLLQRSTVISHCLTAPEFGCAAFEKRWKIVDGKRVITLFPLKIEWTTIYTTPTGEFAGIINMPSSSGIGGSAYMPNELLGPQYSLVVTHDMDAGNLCGQSRYEAAYDAWCDWQWTRLDMAKLRGKLANIIPMLKFPPGSTMLNGKDVDNAIIAQNILSNLGSGRGVALPSVDFSTDAIQDNPKLASTSLWELTFYDAGTYSAAQAGMIETSKYYDNMMAYAWKIRPQQIFDAQNGTKAQAGTHTDSASVDPEQLDNEIAEQLNRQWIDDILLHNFGPDAVGQVFIKPQPLSNPTVEFKQTTISALISSKDPEVISNLDVKMLMQESELPVLDTPKPIPVQPAADGANPAAKPLPADKPDKADPATAMLSRWIEGDVFEMSSDALTGGEWRTINGAHVYMKDGVAVAGPKGVIDKVNGKAKSTPGHLIGKTADEISGHGKTTEEPKEGFHRIDRDAKGTYVGTRDEKNNVSHVPEHAARVKALASKLSPGYTGVHLSKDPDAELQAIGIDAKDRPQYKYSDEHADKAKAKKFARGKELNKQLPAIRERLKADSLSGGKGAEEAHALRLIDHTGFRIGGEKDTGAEKQAYGATTLKAEHVKAKDGKTRVEFVGKKGVDNSHEIHDPEIATELNKRAKSGGKLYNTNDAKVRNYLHEIAPGFVVKDFRTAVAFRTATNEIKSMPIPKTVGDFIAARSKVGEVFSHKLGNTPSVALKDYIDPTVFNQWSATVANGEQAALVAKHAKLTGMNENDAGRDWIGKHGKSYREDFNKRISKNAA